MGVNEPPLVLSTDEVLCKSLTCITIEHWGRFVKSGAGHAVIFLWAKMKLHLRVYRESLCFLKVNNALENSVHCVRDYVFCSVVCLILFCSYNVVAAL